MAKCMSGREQCERPALTRIPPVSGPTAVWSEGVRRRLEESMTVRLRWSLPTASGRCGLLQARSQGEPTIPAPTVSLVVSSIRMKLPVRRLEW
jgi:hypothetical protein